MIPRDVALEQYAHWCGAGLTTAQMLEALTGQVWLFPDAPPSPSYVVDRIAASWCALPVVTISRLPIPGAIGHSG